MNKEETEKSAPSKDLQTAPASSEIAEKKPSEQEPQEEHPRLSSEVFEKLPPEIRREITTVFGAWGPARNPFFDKLKDEHVKQILDYMGEEGKRAGDDRRSTRRYAFWGYFLFGLAGFLAILVFLVLREERQILTGIGVALLGFLGGYGVGKSKH